MEWKKIEDLDLTFVPVEFRNDTPVGWYLILVDDPACMLPGHKQLTAKTVKLNCRMFENDEAFPPYQKDYFDDGRGVVKKTRDGAVLVYFFDMYGFDEIYAYIPFEEMLTEYNNLVKE